MTIREGLVRRLADLGLLTAQEVGNVLPDLTVSEPWMGNGESLMVSLPLHPLLGRAQKVVSLSINTQVSPGCFCIFGDQLAWCCPIAGSGDCTSKPSYIDITDEIDNTSLPNFPTARKSIHECRLIASFTSLYSILLSPYDFP